MEGGREGRRGKSEEMRYLGRKEGTDGKEGGMLGGGM